MTALADLGAISKKTRETGFGGAYDPEFAARQARSKYKQPWTYRAKQGAKQGFQSAKNVKVNPKTAGLVGAGALGSAGIAGLAAHDRAAQKRVNRNYGPQPKQERRKSRNLIGINTAIGAGAGAYLGYGADMGVQSADIAGAQNRAWKGGRAKTAYEQTGAGSGEKFASERERIRVERLRGMAGSHNPHEASNAEHMLRNMGRDPKGHKGTPWEKTKQGAKNAKREAKFKARYGQTWAQTSPMHIQQLQPKMTRVAARRGALIGAGALGATSYASARYTNRKLRREEALSRAEKQARRGRRQPVRKANGMGKDDWAYTRNKPNAWKKKSKGEKRAIGAYAAGTGAMLAGGGLAAHGAEPLGSYYQTLKGMGTSDKRIWEMHRKMPLKDLKKVPGIKRVGGGLALLGAGQLASTGGAMTAGALRTRREIRDQEKRRKALKAKGYM